MTICTPIQKNCRSAKEPGFTLLEVVAVLVVLGVLAALAVPRLSSGLSGPDLMQAENELIRDLRMARSYAMSYQDPGNRATVNPNDYDNVTGNEITFEYPSGKLDDGDKEITIDVGGNQRTICVLAETGSVLRSECRP